jgi:hypothetical protein
MNQRHSVVGLVALLAGTSVLAAERRFIADDFEGARLEARSRKLPILAEVWAPW